MAAIAAMPGSMQRCAPWARQQAGSALPGVASVTAVAAGSNSPSIHSNSTAVMRRMQRVYMKSPQAHPPSPATAATGSRPGCTQRFRAAGGGPRRDPAGARIHTRTCYKIIAAASPRRLASIRRTSTSALRSALASLNSPPNLPAARSSQAGGRFGCTSNLAYAARASSPFIVAEAAFPFNAAGQRQRGHREIAASLLRDIS